MKLTVPESNAAPSIVLHSDIAFIVDARMCVGLFSRRRRRRAGRLMKVYAGYRRPAC